MADSVPVQLYVYDMTNGVAAVMSQMLLGQHIEGIWHTAIVVYGREFFFGSSGIQSCMPVSDFSPHFLDECDWFSFFQNETRKFDQFINLDAVCKPTHTHHISCAC